MPDMQTDVVKWSAVSMETVGRPRNITTVCQPYCHTRQLRFNTIVAQLAIRDTTGICGYMVVGYTVPRTSTNIP